jgi:acetylglutamate kinase
VHIYAGQLCNSLSAKKFLLHKEISQIGQTATEPSMYNVCKIKKIKMYIANETKYTKIKLCCFNP